MPHNARTGATSRQVSERVSRQLALGLLGGILLMLATVFATWWMAGQQDDAARATSRRMVEGGIQAFVERTKTMLLDYAIWTDAYDSIKAGDRAWMYDNIGASADIGTFDMAVVLAPGQPPLGWATGTGPTPADLLDPAAVATARRLIDAVPPEDSAAEVVYARSGGTLWLLAIARVVPQDGLPEDATDADLPRLILGYRMTTATLDGIRRRFQVADLAISPDPVPGRDTLALRDTAGTPLAYVGWTAPTPGRAVLKAALVPLVALMLVAGAVAVLGSRELLGSARRLESALAAASSADRMKTEFLSNVSHELRTPLNGVIGIAQLLQLRQLDPEAREMLKVLLASAYTQLGLVNRLLDITCIESGEMRLDRVPFDAATALDETVRLVAPEIARKGLALRVEVAPEVRRPFVGDPIAFREIVSNLVGNALKFTDRGEIDVRLGAAPAGGLELAVSDTGAGIDPAQHERIFERFFQVDGSTTRRASGAGLGLAISRALAELMHGSIRVDSALGRGASFVVTLPLPPASPDALATAA